jgi:hypothetical protein
MNILFLRKFLQNKYSPAFNLSQAIGVSVNGNNESSNLPLQENVALIEARKALA